jgi:hypothetical protein
VTVRVDAHHSQGAVPISLGRVAQVWWPLAVSWLLMGIEGPVIGAVVARLVDPGLQLAAWGGVVFPLALVIESPVIMLLAASTALSKDRASYKRLRRFTHLLCAGLTVAHLLIVATPLYFVVVEGIMGAPEEIVGPARLGLLLMVPWTWAIGLRRFNQGVLIRWGHSLTVGTGTLVRLAADVVVLVVGVAVGSVQGVVVASLAVVSGVTAEAVYARWRVGSLVDTILPRAAGRDLAEGDDTSGLSRVDRALPWGSLVRFYVPLALTSVIQLAAQPISSAAVARMPQALVSLAAWQVATALFFLLRSPGWAYNEVVVALLERPGGSRALRRFTALLSAGCTAVLVVLLIPPVGDFYFQRMIGLSPDLAEPAQAALWLALPLPAFAVLESWFQGIVVHGRRTRASTEAILLFLAAQVTVLAAGAARGGAAGVYVATVAFGVAELTRTLWLWWRSRPVWQTVLTEEAA